MTFAHPTLELSKCFTTGFYDTVINSHITSLIVDSVAFKGGKKKICCIPILMKTISNFQTFIFFSHHCFHLTFNYLLFILALSLLFVFKFFVP